MVRLEGHPAAGDVLGGETDGRERVSKLDRRGYQRLEGRGRRRALGGRRWDWFRLRGVGGRGGLIAATVILTAAAAELPGNEAQLLVLLETHLSEERSIIRPPQTRTCDSEVMVILRLS